MKSTEHLRTGGHALSFGIGLVKVQSGHVEHPRNVLVLPFLGTSQPLHLGQPSSVWLQLLHRKALPERIGTPFEQ